VCVCAHMCVGVTAFESLGELDVLSVCGCVCDLDARVRVCVVVVVVRRVSAWLLSAGEKRSAWDVNEQGPYLASCKPFTLLARPSLMDAVCICREEVCAHACVWVLLEGDNVNSECTV